MQARVIEEGVLRTLINMHLVRDALGFQDGIHLPSAGCARYPGVVPPLEGKSIIVVLIPIV